MHYDVFNGDADGICALIQLRLAQPLASELITGIKRDIQLLSKINQIQPGDSLTVLDISLEKNISQVEKFLAEGASIFYVDHHQPGVIPQHSQLTTLIDTDNKVCTSLLVNNYLQDKYPLWAITAAFGDNLDNSAEKLAKQINLTEQEQTELKALGIYINYNGYGSSVSDLHFPPDTLYREMVRYISPLDFMLDNAITYQKLAQGYQEDMTKASAIQAEFESANSAVFILPDEAWARRVSGVYGNDLANKTPHKAHAVVSCNKAGGYLISVRAPLNNKTGADEFCSQFETGGGRKSAAGINHLPKEEIDLFIKRFDDFYQNRQDPAN